MFYPIFVENTERGARIHSFGEPFYGSDLSQLKPPPGTVPVWPIGRDGELRRWQVSAESASRLQKDGFLRAGKWNADRTALQYLARTNREEILSGDIATEGQDWDGSFIVSDEHRAKFIPGSLWKVPSHDATRYGTQLIPKFLPGRRFPFPKSLYAVEDALRFYVSNKPEARVLDFFSGSGTTAHAVARLNRQDGGRRQSISVTNNEVSASEHLGLRRRGLRPGDADWEALGICDFFTKPRVTAAITGKTPEGDPIKGDYKFTDEFPIANGFEENAAFFTLTYEDALSVRHDREFAKIAPMLWLRAGSQGRIIEDLGADGWDVAESYGVLKNMDQMGEFVARVGEVDTVGTVFVVTDSDAAFQMTCRDLPGRVTPVRLYESYLHNFQINRRASA